MKQQEECEMKLRSVAQTQEKRHTTGAQYYKDTDVGLAQRRTEVQVQATLAAYEARVKA